MRDVLDNEMLQQLACHSTNRSDGFADVTQDTLFSAMLKRDRKKSLPDRTRKRRWKGVSSSSSVLGPASTSPGETQLMQFWHTNTEDPFTSRKSTVVVPSEPKTLDTDTEGGGVDLETVTPVLDTARARPKRKQGNDSVSRDPTDLNASYDSDIDSLGQTKMETWLSFRPIILDELIRRDGLQEYTSPPLCASCVEEPGIYRCIDCTTPMLYCAPCIVHRHESLPLHRLEVRVYTSSNNTFSSSDRSGMRGFSGGHLSKI